MRNEIEKMFAMKVKIMKMLKQSEFHSPAGFSDPVPNSNESHSVMFNAKQKMKRLFCVSKEKQRVVEMDFSFFVLTMHSLK